MKKKKILWMSATFVAGAIAGIFVLGLYSFTTPSPSPNPTPSLITVDQAKVFFQNYMKTATASNGIVKGIALDKDEVIAMSNLLNVIPTLSGYRLYNGIDDTGGKVCMIVAFDKDGTDLTTTIFSAPVTKMGLCPTVCDMTSPIINK